MQEAMIRGACLCGAVKVSARPKGRDFGACHCSMCRKWTGGPLLAVECEGEVGFEGEDKVSVFASSDWAERGFCSVCGTHLFYRLKEGHLYALPLGLFDDHGNWRFEQQIFIDEKPHSYTFANPTRDMTGAEVFAQFGASPEGDANAPER